jgi:hypothetical protein
MVFERKVLKMIFGPTNERDGTWRIKINDEFDKLIKHKSIINHIKAQRLSWEDDIINDMKKLKIKNWTSCIQDRNKWKLYVEKDKMFKD